MYYYQSFKKSSLCDRNRNTLLSREITFVHSINRKLNEKMYRKNR